MFDIGNIDLSGAYCKDMDNFLNGKSKIYSSLKDNKLSALVDRISSMSDEILKISESNMLVKKCERDLWALDGDGVTVRRLFDAEEPISDVQSV